MPPYESGSGLREYDARSNAASQSPASINEPAVRSSIAKWRGSTRRDASFDLRRTRLRWSPDLFAMGQGKDV